MVPVPDGGICIYYHKYISSHKDMVAAVGFQRLHPKNKYNKYQKLYQKYIRFFFSLCLCECEKKKSQKRNFVSSDIFVLKRFLNYLVNLYLFYLWGLFFYIITLILSSEFRVKSFFPFLSRFFLSFYLQMAA